ncbi:A/G-specific DNA-adenine glycosylase [Collimonas sp. OK242]|jgi:A/G-specific adenine glycosylase|uniref:A/G-specific adenine glycosylase n=1 Tax=Collimonas sp. OK242 TaxID=1798195 RepID=UPI0008990D10|nr:A/G-specific adenine glycosylase [Collimonas sp. OK242]SDY01517.1 A/G-specific DNA-adenine glycosylase [Collimonas sp. OK242]
MKRVVTNSSIGSTESADAQAFADPSFSAAVILWQKQHGRHALPWQTSRDAYRVWLSEIMLQQTQVAAVIPYYQRFLSSFPDVQSLAAAPSEEVMAHWSGLGYYTRARNLHRCAQRVVAEHGGIFPRDPVLLQDLPGIGRSTAAAIAAFSYGVQAAILDGNVKRVFARVFGIDGYPGAKPIEDAMWRRAVALLPEQGVESYTQGLMDLGATLCTRSKPSCATCPLASRCVALAADRVGQLPVRKPKKAIPEKHTGMLVIVDQHQVLLEQRPDSGIWGGLLSLPEIAPGADFEATLHRATAAFGEVASCEPLQPFTHVFTHFKLQISPFQIALKRRLEGIAQASYVWYPAEKLADAPLPAPVKKLLLEVLREADLFA